MKIFLLILAIMIITIVLLQSSKAESASIITGGNSDLFSKRKERGSELVISRLTMILGLVFFLISLIMEFM